jgi:hypothetical protein
MVGKSQANHSVTADSKVESSAGSDAKPIHTTGTSGYVECALPEVQRALSRLFADLQGVGDSYTRAASTNVIIPVHSGEGAERSEELIEELARLHPSRFFVIGFDSSLPKLVSHVTARCHLMGRGPDGKAQHVCSEVVRFVAPPADARALAEALRANLVIGTPTELVLLDPAVEESLLALSLPLCEHVFHDSSMFCKRENLLATISEANLHCVDLQWIALGVWRDQIRAAFDNRATLGLARGLERIEISAEGVRGATGAALTPMASLLLAGWFASRLGLEVRGAAASPSSSGEVSTGGDVEAAKSVSYTLNCASPAGSSVQVVLVSTQDTVGETPEWFGAEGSPEPKLLSVSLHGIVRGGKPASVRLERRERTLEATIRGGDRAQVLSRPFEEEGALARLKRYFLIGESTINYAPALSLALSQKITLQRQLNPQFD